MQRGSDLAVVPDESLVQNCQPQEALELFLIRIYLPWVHIDLARGNVKPQEDHCVLVKHTPLGFDK